MTAAPNVYELKGRAEKAAALVLAAEELFASLRIDTLMLATIRGWKQSDWDGLALRADVRSPSETTQRLVISLLAARAENRKAAL